MTRLLATHNSTPVRWWRRTRSHYVSESAPIVIAGCQRSGTTLLRVILDSHSHIACGPESSLLTGGFLPAKLAERFEMREDEVWRIHANASDHAHFVDLFLTTYAERRGKRRWAEKTPQNIRHLDWIAQHYPKARIVHVLRDGRDVACSIRTHPRYRMVNGEQVPTGIRRALRPCIDCWLKDTAAGMKWRGSPGYTEIRYEDIASAPEPTLRKLCEFLEEPWEPALLEHYRQEGTSRDPKHFITNVTATEPITNRAVQRWRHDMTDGELKLFYEMAGQRLAELGYPIDAHDMKETAARGAERAAVAIKRGGS